MPAPTKSTNYISRAETAELAVDEAEAQPRWVSTEGPAVSYPAGGWCVPCTFAADERIDELRRQAKGRATVRREKKLSDNNLSSSARDAAILECSTSHAYVSDPARTEAEVQAELNAINAWLGANP